MASVVAICNRALQLLGSAYITSLDDASKAVSECSNCYETLRDAETQANPWGFAKRQVQLAALTEAPLFDFSNAFQLPADFLRYLPPRRGFNPDWEIFGRQLYTNDAAPLNLTYLAQVTDTAQMHPLFREALSAAMAFNMCEALTQSNTKKADALTTYKLAIQRAKAVSAIEKSPQTAVADSWVTVRRVGTCSR